MRTASFHGFSLALIMMAATALPVSSAQAADDDSGIHVTGTATVSAAPDRAEVDGGVTTDAKTAREASEANNRVMSAVVDALKKAGVADADMRTSRLSLYPQSAQPAGPNTPPQIVGYRATNRVIIRISDVKAVAGMIDTLIAAGATDIGGINFIVSNASKLLDDARVQAIADARRKAEIYARAAGVRLGAPLSISEDGGGGPVPVRAAMRADMAMTATPISPGEETLRVIVSVSYEIED